MSSTKRVTKKFIIFMDSTLYDKPPSFIPGIGRISCKKLNELGLFKASNILGRFLYLDESDFILWLKSYGVNSHNSITCYNALKQYAVLKKLCA